MIELYPHQQQALADTADKNRVAYYHDMGLGKTFTGSEKLMQLGARVNLVVCQKSKIQDWCDHFNEHYRWYKKNIAANEIFDLTNKKQFSPFLASVMTQNTKYGGKHMTIGIINYDLIFRRPELAKLRDFTLLLDESSLIQNETSKRSRFILKKLNPANVILLSGTPTGGKYEKLWSQMHLLGWPISKKLYWRQFIETETLDNEGYPIVIVKGYKNVDRLKRKMREYGCNFLKTEEVLDLPKQIDQTIKIGTSSEYRKFRKTGIVRMDGQELVGDMTLTKMLYERQLCGHYNKDKLKAFRDLVESTEDRLIVFYNFTAELHTMQDILDFEIHRPYSTINGEIKNLKNYENRSDSITFIQYQAGAMGLNLQKANKIVYFTPPLSSELFEQSKKRIHRIGQTKSCFYYYLTCRNSVEEKIYRTLAMRKDYTEALFEKEN